MLNVVVGGNSHVGAPTKDTAEPVGAPWFQLELVRFFVGCSYETWIHVVLNRSRDRQIVLKSNPTLSVFLGFHQIFGHPIPFTGSRF